MTLSNKKINLLFFILIVSAFVPNMHFSAELTSLIYETTHQQKIAEIALKMNYQDEIGSYSELNQSISRSVLRLITNDTYSLNDRYNIANFYTSWIAKNNEDLVLYLMTYELSKIYNAEVVRGINSDIVFNGTSWCILFIHGSLQGNSYIDELVKLVSSSFKVVILASCYSYKYIYDYSNVKGFSGEITLSSVLSLSSTLFGYSPHINIIINSPLSKYELEVTPAEFVNTIGIFSDCVVDALFDIFNFNYNTGWTDLKPPEIITLEKGIDDIKPKFGCDHINAQWGDRMGNRHIEEIFYSAETFLFWTFFNLYQSNELLIVHLNPQTDDKNDDWWVSYVLIGIRPPHSWTDEYPTPYYQGYHPYFTIKTAGFYLKKAGEPNAPSYTRILNYFRFGKQYDIHGGFTVRSLSFQDQALKNAPLELSEVAEDYLSNFGNYIDQKAENTFNSIILFLPLGIKYLREYVLEPFSQWCSEHPTVAKAILIALIAILIVACVIYWGLVPVIGFLTGVFAALHYYLEPIEDEDHDEIPDYIEEYYFNLYIVGTPDEQLYQDQETTWLDGKIDYDGDGLFTYVETKCNPNLDPDLVNPFLSDSDNDGISDYDENYTNSPYLTDIDDDGVPDFIEEIYFDLEVIGTDSEPIYQGQEKTWLEGDVDQDGDGLPAYIEIAFKSDPYDTDTDKDGLLDNEEIIYNVGEPLIYHSNPFLRDTDGDGLGDYEESLIGLDAQDPDTDDDGLLDGWEVYANQIGWGCLKLDFSYVDPFEPPSNPGWAGADTDCDGFNNSMESWFFTNPFDEDTDGDDLADIDETMSYSTDPTSIDSDFDGLDDGFEVGYSNPTNRDTDNDGMLDGWEEFHNLNLLVNDASLDPDSDGLTNLEEQTTNTDPNNSDSDNDGLTDGYEINTSNTDPMKMDTDDDGMPDGWEVDNWLKPLTKDANLDPDVDFLTNLEEYQYGTNPFDADTDNDGLLDGYEVHNYNTDALDSDTDNDGLLDGHEVYIYNTDALDSDTDNDGLTDGDEVLIGTNPNTNDTDNDSIPDGWEVLFNLDPLTNDTGLDPDSDGLTNLEEYQYGTIPNISDTDNDGLLDGHEVYIYYTDALDSDTDNDGLSDGAEVLTYGTNPLDADTDNDGLTDGYEINTSNTDPTKIDTDDDGMSDLWEVMYGLNPIDPSDASDDQDGDGLSNLEEYNECTDPNNIDTDGDGWNDYMELYPPPGWDASDPNDPYSVPSIGGWGFLP